MSLPDHLPVDSNILSLVSSESYCVSYPVTLYCYSSVTKAHILPYAVTTLQIGSYSGLDSSPYGIPSSNHIEDRPVYLVYYR